MNREIYSKIVLQSIPRLLSLLDKNMNSPYYGCFDRAYWTYRQTDFVNARLQEAALTLALLYENNFQGNSWYKQDLVRNWAIASMLFWSKIQHKDGTFDEAYPNEHSHVATSFSAFAIAESYRILKKHLNAKQKNMIISSLLKSAEWLAKNEDSLVSNHDAGSIAALCSIYTLTGKEKIKTYFKKKIIDFLKLQTTEGWFPEYGGADIGYTTLTIYYLANYFNLCKDKSILDSLKKAIHFLSYFIHPDGSAGGIYGSRNTYFFVPDGFEILSDIIPLASSIVEKNITALKELRTLTPLSFDDRYICNTLYTYLQAYLDHKEILRKPLLPFEGNDFETFFSISGLFLKKASDFYSIINGFKGGNFKIYSLKNEKSFINDNGWIGKTSKGFISSSLLDRKNRIVKTKSKVSIEGSFKKINFTSLSSSKMIQLRTLMSTLGRSRLIRETVRNLIRNKLITGINRIPIRFLREIIFEKSEIKVIDTFKLMKNVNLETLGMDKGLGIYTASGGLFSTIEDYYESVLIGNIAKKLTKERIAKVSRTIFFDKRLRQELSNNE